MTYQRILVTGGTGYIGQPLVARLAGQHHDVVVPSRRRKSGRDLFLLPTVEVVQANIHQPGVVEELVANADAVINLVGVLHSDDGDPYGNAFRRSHVDLPERLAKACAKGGQRLIHISALGADPGSNKLPSGYLRSKADGEKAITASDCKNWTILRPSVVFGPGDQFLNLFARLQRIFPVVALGRANAQIQPVFLGDVVTAISNVLNNGATHGKHYELAGPEIYTLRELVQLAGRYAGCERKVISLSDKMGLLQARILQKLPGQLMSVDNFESLAKPSIATEPVAPELGINPTALSVIAPQYLGNQVSRFNEPRERARR